MFCTDCGATIEVNDAFCANCGVSLKSDRPVQASAPRRVVADISGMGADPPRDVTTNRQGGGARLGPPLPGNRRALTIPAGAAGLFLGGLVGFVLRPSVFLIGQLPLGTVLTRGANLSGLDQILVPAAQSSFNLMVIAALVGAAMGAAIGAFLDRQSGSSAAGRQAHIVQNQ